MLIGLVQCLTDLADEHVEAGTDLFKRLRARRHRVHVRGQIGGADRFRDLRLEILDRRVDVIFRLFQARGPQIGIVDRRDRDEAVLLDTARHFREKIEATLRVECAVDGAVRDVKRVDHTAAGREGDEQAPEDQKSEAEADRAHAARRSRSARATFDRASRPL